MKNFTCFLNKIFMLKNILRLLAASASLVALLFLTNPAIASTTTTTPVVTLNQQLRSPVMSLNVASPFLQLASNQDALSNHVGCSCAVCTQVVR
jgi:hypothetical protein